MDYDDIYTTGMTGKYILFFIFIAMLIYGIVSGDVIETWKNGATL